MRFYEGLNSNLGPSYLRYLGNIALFSHNQWSGYEEAALTEDTLQIQERDWDPPKFSSSLWFHNTSCRPELRGILSLGPEAEQQQNPVELRCGLLDRAQSARNVRLD